MSHDSFQNLGLLASARAAREQSTHTHPCKTHLSDTTNVQNHLFSNIPKPPVYTQKGKMKRRTTQPHRPTLCSPLIRPGVQLQVGIAMVGARGVDAVLVGDDLRSDPWNDGTGRARTRHTGHDGILRPLATRAFGPVARRTRRTGGVDLPWTNPSGRTPPPLARVEWPSSD